MQKNTPIAIAPQTTRLQKYLSERGAASRRAAAEMILAGRVTVNGSVATIPGMRVDCGKDTVALDGKPLAANLPPKRTIMLNKPRGYICSKSSREGKSVMKLLPPELQSLVPVGRLDQDSEGLLLLSNDGNLALRLTHPRFEVQKRYHASVSGTLDAKTMDFLRSPMPLDGRPIIPAEVHKLRAGLKANRHLLEFIIREGRNRQVRRMCENAGLKVHRLSRVQVGSVTIGGLRPAQWRDLTKNELASLQNAKRME